MIYDSVLYQICLYSGVSSSVTEASKLRQSQCCHPTLKPESIVKPSDHSENIITGGGGGVFEREKSGTPLGARLAESGC